MCQSDQFTKGSYDLSTNEMYNTNPESYNNYNIASAYINTNSSLRSNTNSNKPENPKSILKKVHYDEIHNDNNGEQYNHKSESNLEQSDINQNITKKTLSKNTSGRVNLVNSNSNIKGKAYSNSKVVESKRKVPTKK